MSESDFAQGCLEDRWTKNIKQAFTVLQSSSSADKHLDPGESMWYFPQLLDHGVPLLILLMLRMD